MTTIDFIYFDAGGGHRSAATALKMVIEMQARPWQVRMVNLQELLDPLDIFRKITRVRLEDLYNRMLARGWTFGAAQSLKVVHAIIRANHKPIVKLLSEHWKLSHPDLVVSLVPNFNRALHESLKTTLPGVSRGSRLAKEIPFVTILTDFADYPPHFWMEPQPQYFICGTEKAVQQAYTMGHTPERVFRVSGMILRPKFYDPVTANRCEERERLGLDPSKPTALVLFGGHGSKIMAEIARNLPDTQLILICGRNQKLAETLKTLRGNAPRFVEGFTSEIPYYMSLADFFIGKPGPGSISEAVAMKLPVIVECNSWTLPQERYNAEWVREKNAGIVLGSFREIGSAVERMLAEMPKFRASVEVIHNRAVYQIPEILEKLV